jgi:hypothetical protein
MGRPEAANKLMSCLVNSNCSNFYTYRMYLACPSRQIPNDLSKKGVTRGKETWLPKVRARTYIHSYLNMRKRERDQQSLLVYFDLGYIPTC